MEDETVERKQSWKVGFYDLGDLIVDLLSKFG